MGAARGRREKKKSKKNEIGHTTSTRERGEAESYQQARVEVIVLSHSTRFLVHDSTDTLSPVERLEEETCYA